MYLFSTFEILLWTHAYLFYALGFNAVYFYLIAQIVPDLTIGSSFHWLLWSSDIPPSLFVCFWAFPCFMAQEDVPGLSCIFPASALELSISLRIPGFLYWEIRLETNARCVHCYWCVLASRPCQLTEQGNICVYIPLMFHSSQVAASYFFLRFVLALSGRDKEQYA